MLARSALMVAAAILLAACGSLSVPGGPGTTQRPGGGTAAPGGSVAIPAGGTCTLVTPDEMTQIFGVQMTVTDTANNTCTYTATGGLPSIVLRFEQTDLSTARVLLGKNAADVTVSGNPGVIGSLFGVILYVQHGGQDLVVQSVMLDDNADNRNKIVAVATKALSRVP